ncbi:SIMPL domain-containing protein [Ferrovibrio sp.]|uniref:SIMPL domain-containing protein n=1 Tax=Ferrovibrio sp. TaxID=1917215 RepID=UPI0035146199
MALRRLSILAVLAALALPPVAAAAQERSLPADATLLSLSESAERDVTPDTMRARVAAEAVSDSAAAAQAGVNAAMTRALAMLRAMGIEVETGGYRTWQETPPRPASLPAGAKPPPAQWHAQQSVTLTGQDSDRLLAAVGELQKEGLLLQDLGFMVSRAQQRAGQDEMTAEALRRLTARAEQAAGVLGLRFAGWHRVGINGGGLARPMMMQAMKADRMVAGAPPVAAPGEQTLSITVDGEAILRRP